MDGRMSPREGQTCQFCVTDVVLMCSACILSFVRSDVGLVRPEIFCTQIG